MDEETSIPRQWYAICQVADQPLNIEDRALVKPFVKPRARKSKKASIAP